MQKLVTTKQNEVYKSADKLRRQFNKGEMGTEEFIKQYMKEMIEFHQMDVTLKKLQHVQ